METHGDKGESGNGGGRGRGEEREREMEDVGARGRTEGDSGVEARKWVRGEDADVEEEEGESDEARWRGRYQRKERGRDGWRGEEGGMEGGSQWKFGGHILQVPSDKPDGVLAFLGKQRLYVQTEQ